MMLVVGKTEIIPKFDSGTYMNAFTIHNEYLNSFWFKFDDDIWEQLSSVFAVVVEQIVKNKMKDKMNEESYKKIFGENNNQESKKDL